MNKLMCIFLAVAAVGAFADEAANDGGLVKVGGKGRLAVVDCGSGLDWSRMTEVFEQFDNAFHIEVVRQTGAPFAIESAAEAVTKTGANAALFVCDKPGYPMTLMATEQKWAFINLAPLKADKANFEKRCQYLLMRGIYRALGSDISRAEKSCLSPVYKPADLDAITDLCVGMDTFISVGEAARALGIEQIEYLTYREACQSNIAPPPTNDVQRAIAAEVKAKMSARRKQQKK